MKNIMRISIALIIALGTVSSAQGIFTNGASERNNKVLAYNEQKVIVKLDGKTVAFPDTQPYVNEDSRTMVPVRFVTEAMGCDVQWEEANQMVIITKASKRILLQIGQNWAIVNDSKSDVRKEFDTKAVLKDDRTMVPLRFVSEMLGAGVAWDEANNTVVIRSDGTVENTPTPTPTSNEKFPDVVHKDTPSPSSTPVPTPTDTVPSPTNPIIGNPYYSRGLTSKDDLVKYARLQPLFQYNDIICISGDENKKDDGKVNISYGQYNEIQKRVQGYLAATFSETSKLFKIQIGKYGESEIKRLREVIDIGVEGNQEYKDFVYNAIIGCKNGTTTGNVIYSDGSTLFVSYMKGGEYDTYWGDSSFNVTVWRSY